MALTVLAATALMVFGARGRALVPSRAQSAAEMTYGFIYKMVEDVAGHDAVRFFPYIFTLFLFVLFANLAGPHPVCLYHHVAYRSYGGFGLYRFLCGDGAGVHFARDQVS